MSEVRRFISNSGSRIKPIYGAKVHENGSIEVVQTGEEDLQDYIESFEESVDLNNIVAQYTATGDEEVLNQVKGMYGDFTQLPTTYAGFLQTLIDAHRMFDSLTADQKSRFDNDFNRFLSSVNEADFIDRIKGVNSVSDSTTRIVEEDNKEGDSE